jgi:hypothetical protein
VRDLQAGCEERRGHQRQQHPQHDAPIDPKRKPRLKCVRSHVDQDAR